MQRLFAPLLILIFVSACTYSPEGEFFKEIPKLSPIDVISLNDYNDKDTIRIYQATQFNFELSTTQGPINDLQILISGNSQGFSSQDGKNYSFKIDNTYYNLKSGKYQLEIAFTHHSGTGSLTDKQGYETVTVLKKWVLIIDIDAPPQPLLKFSEENGYLKVSWTPLSKQNFKSYTLDIYRTNWYNQQVIITDPTKSFWIDSGYVTGFEMKYFISSQTLYTESGSSGVYTDPQNFTVDYNANDSTASITWNKPKAYNAFKSYEIINDYDVNHTIISDINDTTLIVKLKKVVYGRGIGIALQVNPVTNSYSAYIQSGYIQNPCNAERLVGYPQSIIYDITSHNILAFKYDQKACYYNSDMQEVDSIDVGSDYSVPRGNFSYSGSPYDHKLISYNLFTKTQDEINFNMEPNLVTGPWNIQGSASTRVSYGYITNVSGFYRYVENIYDFSTGTLIYTSFIPYTSTAIEFTNPSLSVDGKYAYFNNTKSVYKVNANSLQLSGTLSTGNMIGFRDDDTDEFLFQPAVGNGVEIRSSTDLSLKRTVTSPGGDDIKYQGYDPGSGYILFGTLRGEDMYFVHIDTGKVKHINVFTNSDYYYQYKLVGGYLFDNDANYIKIF